MNSNQNNAYQGILTSQGSNSMQNYEQAQNCGQGAASMSCIGYQGHPYYTYVAAPAAIEIRYSVNGFIVKKNSLEYVFNTSEDMAAWLIKELAVAK